ncbi:MAG: CpsB/CapC family capsule biosynthesis tyrosine phosphatase [Butyricicoccus sp.]
MIVDFHSHILPGIDDGSPDTETSMRMLKEMLRQKIDCVVATPHFYIEEQSVDRFLERRARAEQRLRQAMDADGVGIRIAVGAEVAFFTGIGQFEDVDRLCIAGTNVLLLEMPFRTWSRQDMREINSLIQRGFVLVIAHLERYGREKSEVEMLLSLPVYAQMNAGCLLHWRTRRQPLRWVKEGAVQLLGSDCHDLTRRPPNLQAGRDVLRKKVGSACLEQIDLLGQNLIETVREDNYEEIYTAHL